MRIGLIGAAGLGKSTFAKEISKQYDLVFLKSKDITRPILKKFKYQYTECIEYFLAKKEIEFELISDRIYQESILKTGFVTDRTILECFAYALLNCNEYSNDELDLLENLCKKQIKNYTHLFYFPYECGWFEENGIRTTNAYFQRKVDMIIRGLLKDWNVSYSTVPEKKEEIKQFIFNSLN